LRFGLSRRPIFLVRTAHERPNKVINAVLAEPEMQERLVELDGDTLIGTPDAFGAMHPTP
jgi:hypothetical protein